MSKLTHRVSRGDLAAEQKEILTFVTQRLKLAPGEGLHMAEIFGEYQLWRVSLGYRETFLSLDGFGRLFPSTFERGRMYRNGKQLHGIVGVGFK